MRKYVGIDLLNNPVGPSLFKLAYPMLYGVFSMTAFNFVDTYFVSLLGTEPLAAMGFTFPIIMFVGAIAFGLGIGTSSLVSRTIGAGRRKDVSRIVTDSIILSIIIVVIVAIGGILTMKQTFLLLGVDASIYPLVDKFMRIWYWGVVFFIVPMIGNNAMRGAGDTIIPSLIMVIGTVINVILDPIMIFGLLGFPRMGISGAALATVISRAIVLVVSFYFLHYRHQMINIRRISFRRLTMKIVVLIKKHTLIVYYLTKIKRLLLNWIKILYVGLPAAMTTLCIPFAIAAVTRISAYYGHDAVAAISAGRRIQSLIFIVFMALGAAIVPFAGQNWGAKKLERILKGFNICIKFSLIYGLVMFILIFLLSGSVSHIFTNDSEVAKYLGQYICFATFTAGLQGICVIACRMLTAMNRPLHSALLNFFRFFVLYIPLVYLGALYYGVLGIFAGICLANGLTGVFAICYIRFYLLKLQEKLRKGI